MASQTTNRRKSTGNRFHDQKYTKFLYLFLAFFVGHFITKKFPGVISEFSTELLDHINNTVNAVGGLGMLAFIFQVYKWYKEKNKSSK